ncbi:helix-turn-helix transcriptional regulator [Edaphovirga cremea]|uniref:helix-turn-helix transcriptional regulator n=1 Tax=Edaphovirga cremea TaxID=2267246 RepID=UPI00398A0F21
MELYEFTLIFSLAETRQDPEVHVAALLDAGCDDALIGVGTKGRIALNFSREAETALDALTSAFNDVKKAIPDARIAEAAPDWVGLSDVAGLLGCSRQYMRKLMVTQSQAFPLPVHDGSTSVWNLESVLTWLKQHKSYPVAATLFDISVVTRQFNLYQQIQQARPQLQQHFRAICH